MAQENVTDMNRRNFVTAAAAAGLGMMALPCCLEEACAQATTQPSSSTKAPFDAGPKSDFAKDGVNMTFAKSHRTILATEDGKLYAMTVLCTHRRAPLILQGDHLHCPRHNTDFKFDGTVIPNTGPAKMPLVRFGVSVNDDGHVIVDPGQQFQKDEWTDPKSFVPMA
jgi:nitrite reductase/ring-hydroxylating ferredoxin subunit